jgi:imidazoleglycerol-phosphate dehydratase
MTKAKPINIVRKTRETEVNLTLELEGDGSSEIETGIGFFDHMLSTLALWAGWDLSLTAAGDLDIDNHHTVEDVALTLGQALAQALEARGPVARVGSSTIPMDEALSRAVVDLSGRPFCVYKASLAVERMGSFETITTGHFFRSFATTAQLTLHVENLYGEDPHHQVESMFKAVGAALAQAQTPRAGEVLSTKGSL